PALTPAAGHAGLRGALGDDARAGAPARTRPRARVQGPHGRLPAGGEGAGIPRRGLLGEEHAAAGRRRRRGGRRGVLSAAGAGGAARAEAVEHRTAPDLSALELGAGAQRSSVAKRSARASSAAGRSGTTPSGRSPAAAPGRLAREGQGNHFTSPDSSLAQSGISAAGRGARSRYCTSQCSWQRPKAASSP